jgi:hypothetical protein
MTQANQDGFKDLETRLNTLIDTIITLLKNKNLSDIPLVLQTGLIGLEQYDFTPGHPMIYLNLVTVI